MYLYVAVLFISECPLHYSKQENLFQELILTFFGFCVFETMYTCCIHTCYPAAHIRHVYSIHAAYIQHTYCIHTCYLAAHNRHTCSIHTCYLAAHIRHVYSIHAAYIQHTYCIHTCYLAVHIRHICCTYKAYIQHTCCTYKASFSCVLHTQKLKRATCMPHTST